MALNAQEILFKGRAIFEKAIADEALAQGHYLTGNLERSQTATVTIRPDETILEGEIAYYANILNEGVRPEKASMKQFPFVVKFFELRGLAPKEAKQAAAATIRKWMKEGMPTANSYAYSSNGRRKQLLTVAIKRAGKKVDTEISKAVDKEIDTLFRLTKNEKI